MSRSFSWVISLLIAVAFFAVVILGIVTIRNMVKMRKSEQAVAGAHKTRNLVIELLSSVKDAETGQRGYLLTGDDSYLKPYHAGREKTGVLAVRLKQELAKQPEQLARLSEIEQLAIEKHDLLAMTIELCRQDRGGQGFENAREVVQTNRGKVLMTQIRQLTAKMTDQEEQLLQAHLDEAESRANANKRMIISGNLIALTLMALAAGGMYFDRARRSEAEANLAANRERLNAVIDSSPDGIITLDRELRFTMINPAAEAIYGCVAADMIGKPVDTFILASRREQVRQRLANFLVSDQVRQSLDGTAQRTDSSIFPIEGTLAKSVVGGEPFIIFSFKDLSEQESSRAKIREQAAVLDQITDAIHIDDPEGRITYWNQGSQKLFGWSSEEAIGHMAAELMFSNHLPEQDEAQQAVKVAGVWQGETQKITKCGREIRVEQRRTLLRNAEGNATGQLVINIDITDRKRLEMQERRTQRLESVGTLAGGIAHDLNNVLTPITMGANLLKKEPADENRLRLAETILTCAQRGASMIKQLLSFAGGERTDREVVDLQVVVKEIEAILSHTLPKTITVEFEQPDHLWNVLGDPTELSQVLMNMAINARDAMPNGGTLTLGMQNLTIQEDQVAPLQLQSPGKYVCLTVADTGAGMPPEVLEQAFDPFFTTKEQGQGTGLGLATCLGIVKGFGGSINVYCELGSGTKFAVYLPAEQHHETQAMASPADVVPTGSGETILLVDDEILILEMAQSALESNGYRVQTAGGGAEALAILQHDDAEIKVAIVDMMMPGMDGQTTMDGLRLLRPDLPMIASSGLRRPDAGEHRIRGAQAFLPKPYSDEQILRTIRQVLDKQPSLPSSTQST